MPPKKNVKKNVKKVPVQKEKLKKPQIPHEEELEKNSEEPSTAPTGKLEDQQESKRTEIS